jgi:hypothetical protein
LNPIQHFGDAVLRRQYPQAGNGGICAHGVLP